MIKNIIDRLPLATILVSYFFVCGSLYLIGFWTTFKIDITNFVSITDIPKSFILPFVLSQGLFLFQLLTNLLSTPIHKDEPFRDIEKNDIKPKWKRILVNFLNWDTLFIIAVAIIVANAHNHFMSATYWTLSSLTMGFYLVYKFTSFHFVKQRIQYPIIRLYSAYIICFLPIFCFSTGKVLSLNIYNNKEIIYLNKISDCTQSEKTEMNFSKRDSSSLKILGFLGDKLIISSINNKKIIFINQSSYKNLELTRE